MPISDYVQPDSIFLNLDVTDKEDLLEQLLDAMEKTPVYAAQPPEIRERMRPMILQRESYGSTAIGNGILFPHARVPGFTGLLLLIATCKKALSMPTPDGQPVFLASLAIVPAERPSLALKVVSALSRLFANDEARSLLRDAEKPQQVTDYITAHDAPLESVIYVSEVSQPYEWLASPGTPVREIARQMLRYRMPGVAVVDDDGQLIGEITLTRLERFGLPNFFLNLQSVSFVRQFDPFEQYFLKEAQSVATDVMNEEFVSLPEDGTLMEAIHALAVKRRALVHVCQDGRAVGYVDSLAVLNRVLSP